MGLAADYADLRPKEQCGWSRLGALILVHPHSIHREFPLSLDLKNPCVYEEANYNVRILASRTTGFFQFIVAFISYLLLRESACPTSGI